MEPNKEPVKEFLPQDLIPATPEIQMAFTKELDLLQEKYNVYLLPTMFLTSRVAPVKSPDAPIKSNFPMG